MNLIQSILAYLFGPSPTPPNPVPIPPPADGWQSQLLAAINAQRAANGLAGLALDPALSTSSQAWAEAMAASQQLDHGDFAGRIASVYPNTAAGENIAEGYPDPTSVATAWMGDPGHRANMLGAWSILGVGRASDTFGNLYWVADFDQPA